MVTKKTESLEENPLKKSSTTLTWGSWLRIGIAVLLIVGAYIVGVLAGMDTNKGYRYSGEKYGKMMEHGNKSYEMMQKKGMPMMNHDMDMMDPMDMSMRDMGKMLEGKTGEELNKAFLEGMIPHHQGAIDMAKYLAASNKPELVKLGADIIDAQTREIEQMQQWMQEWGYASTGAMATEIMNHAMMNH